MKGPLPLLPFVAVLMLIWTAPGFAHDWYTGMKDPVTQESCCNGNDCYKALVPGTVTPMQDGFHVRLTREQIILINPKSELQMVDEFIPFARVQWQSHDGNFHICLRYYPENYPQNTPTTKGVRCFFAPGNS